MFRKRPVQDMKRQHRIGQKQHEPLPVTTAPEAPEPDPFHQLGPGEGGAAASIALMTAAVLGSFTRRRRKHDPVVVDDVTPLPTAEEMDRELDVAVQDMHRQIKRRQEADAIRAKACRTPTRSGFTPGRYLRPNRQAIRLKSQKLRRRHHLGEFAPGAYRRPRWRKRVGETTFDGRHNWQNVGRVS